MRSFIFEIKETEHHDLYVEVSVENFTALLEGQSKLKDCDETESVLVAVNTDQYGYYVELPLEDFGALISTYKAGK